MVILYGNVYDVTDFLPSHPFITIRVRIDLYKYWGLASQNATEEYDPVTPPRNVRRASEA